MLSSGGGWSFWESSHLEFEKYRLDAERLRCLFQETGAENRVEETGEYADMMCSLHRRSQDAAEKNWSECFMFLLSCGLLAVWKRGEEGGM
jgi:hypothetical protein